MATQVPSRLYRSRSQKMIAGVCGGLGEYFDVDPVLIRLLFVVTAFVGSGAGVLAYIVLWIVVPFEGDDSTRLDALKRDFDDISGRVRDYVDRPSAGRSTGPRGDAPSGSTTAGGTPPAAAPDQDPAARPSTPPDPDAAAQPHTSQPYEEASMSTDTTTTSTPRRDDPTTPGAADDLSLGSDPLGPPPGTEARTASYGPADTATGAPYGTPYTPPPPYGSAAYEPAPDATEAAPTDRRRRRQHWAGAILIVLGLLILGNNLGILWWIEPTFFLPLLLVGAGAWLLLGRGRRG